MFGQGDSLLGFEALPPGVKAAIVQSRAGSSRVTNWRLVESGCLAVKRVVETGNPDGTYTRVFEYRPVYIVLGEPSGVLFDEGSIVAPYEEMAPSKVRDKFVTAFGLSDGAQCPGCFSPAWEGRDRKYNQFKPQ